MQRSGTGISTGATPPREPSPILKKAASPPKPPPPEQPGSRVSSRPTSKSGTLERRRASDEVVPSDPGGVADIQARVEAKLTALTTDHFLLTADTLCDWIQVLALLVQAQCQS